MCGYDLSGALVAPQENHYERISKPVLTRLARLRLIKSSSSSDQRESPVPSTEIAPSLKPAPLTFPLTFQDLLFRLQAFWAERLRLAAAL